MNCSTSAALQSSKLSLHRAWLLYRQVFLDFVPIEKNIATCSFASVQPFLKFLDVFESSGSPLSEFVVTFVCSSLILVVADQNR